MNEPMNQGGSQPMNSGNQEWPQDNSSPQTPFENSAPLPTSTPPPAMSTDDQPLVMEEQQSSGSLWILVGILAVLLIAGGLVLASWQGWISLGGIEKLWGGGQTTTNNNNTDTNTNTNTPTPKVNANDAKRKSDLAKIKAALLKYYNEKQAYPAAEAIQKTTDPSNILTTTLIPNYLTAMPADPVASKYYGYKSDGKSFELSAVLEDKTDPAGIMVGTIFLYRVTDTSTESTASNPSSSTTGGSSNTGSSSNSQNGTNDDATDLNNL
jgi:hypothetical protein